MMSTSKSNYSDLPETVAQHPVHEGLQADTPEKIAWSGQHTPDKFIADKNWQQQPYEQPQEHKQEQRRQRRICGLVPWLFWLVVGIAALVVVAAAVGGGVGGSLAKKNSSDSSSGPAVNVTALSSSTATSSSSGPITSPATTTTSSTVSVTTTEVVSATSTLYRDCPSVNNTIYSYGSTNDPMEFRQVCGLAYLNSGGGTVVNQAVQSLADCINLCAAYNVQNQTEIDTGSSVPCSAVCWRNTFDTDFPGQCFGYTTANNTGEFVVQNSTVCDSAAWINQSL